MDNLNIVVEMKFGSHLYGLQTPQSDTDYKGIYLPDIREILLGNYAGSYKQSTGGEHQKNTKDDVDTEIMALPNFIDFACRGETFALDMVHCTEPLKSSDIWEFIVQNRTKFYSKDMKAYIGYVKKQAAKYGLKGTRLACIRKAMEFLEEHDPKDIIGQVRSDLYYGEYAQWVEHNPPNGSGTQYFYEVNSKKYQSTNTVEYVLGELTKVWDSYGERAKQAETNEGVDFKALSHALRAGYQARDIYKDGDFEYPLKETDFIKQVKLGQLDYKTVIAPELERLVDEVNVLADKSSLPSKVDRKFWDEFLLRAYHEPCYQWVNG